MKKIFILLTTIFVIACSSEDNSKPILTVDLLGDWAYALTTQGTVCDGVTAVGTVTISSLNGDLSKIGGYLVQGEWLDLDNPGSCSVVLIDVEDDNWVGRPGTETIDQYQTYSQQDEAGEIFVDSVAITIFTTTRIVQVTEFSNGASITSDLTR